MMNMCGGLLGGAPSATPAQVVSAPPATSVAKSMEDPSIANARKEEERRRKARFGAKESNVTGGLGEVATGALGKTELLGG